MATVFNLATEDQVSEILDQIKKDEGETTKVVNKRASILTVTQNQAHLLTVAEQKANLALRPLTEVHIRS